MSDEAKSAEASEAEERDAEREVSAPEYIEYAGDPEHGTAFLTSHTIPRGDMLWRRNQVTMTKDLTWERDPYGPAIGQKGSRMLLAVDGIPAEALRVLETTPGFKRVTVE